VLAIASRRLWRLLPVPLEQGRSHGLVGRGVHRILNIKNPRHFRDGGFLYLRA
jgi:hypothetical protein